MKNESWQIDILKDLNASKLSSEEHSVEIISQIDALVDEANNSNASLETIKDIAMDIINKMQYHDLNRQKIERAMNIFVENENISNELLEQYNISIAPSAKHLDNNDGESISDDDLAELIANSNRA
jgi:transcriptional regulator NrdR family protein